MNAMEKNKLSGMQDLISVVVPVYNVEAYLDKCVESIVNQTYKNLEIILVDDGSPDSSSKLCASWIERDPRVKIIHKRNGGLSDARNMGVNLCSGEYVFFVDSDDYICEETIEALWNKIKRNDADIAVCGINDVDVEAGELIQQRKSKMEERVFDTKDALKTLLYDGNEIGIVAWNKLYKRALFSNLKFEIGKLHEDVFFTPKVLSYSSKIVTTNFCGYNYVVNRVDSICNNITIKSLDAADGHYSNYLFFMSGTLNCFAGEFFARSNAVLIAYACDANYFGNTSVEKKAIELLRKRFWESVKVYSKYGLYKSMFRYFSFLLFKRAYYSLRIKRWRKRDGWQMYKA